MADEGLREGDRIIPASRRPDGSLRKEIRIRAGYVPQDEVATYQSKGSGFRGVPGLPPGLDPADNAASKAKTKAAKKNEKRKEKKKQGKEEGAAEVAAKQNNRPDSAGEQCKAESKAAGGGSASDSSKPLKTQFTATQSGAPQAADSGAADGGKADTEKKIRALRKKIRQTESLEATVASGAVLTPEQSEKLAKLRSWEEEVAQLEAQLAAL